MEEVKACYMLESRATFLIVFGIFGSSVVSHFHWFVSLSAEILTPTP
jgi:hypothetical protein